MLAEQPGPKALGSASSLVSALSIHRDSSLGVNEIKLHALDSAHLQWSKNLLHFPILFNPMFNREAVLSLQMIEDWPQATVVAARGVC